MRIGIFVECFVVVAGGIDTVVVNQLNHWPNPEDTFVVICNKSHPAIERIYRPRLNARYRLELMPSIPLLDAQERLSRFMPVLAAKALTLYGRYLLAAWNAVVLVPFFRRLHLDAIFFHNGGMPGGDTERSGVLSARWAGIEKVFMVVHNVAQPAKSIQKPMEDLFDRLVDRNAHLVCVCEASKRSMYAIRKFRRPIEVIYNGLAFDQPGVSEGPPESLKRELEGRFVVATTASFEPNKGHRDLFEALRVLADRLGRVNVHSLLLGDGTPTQRAEVKRWIAELGLENRVTLCGFQSNIAAYLDVAHLFVFPSRRGEAFPMSILEAMARGLPVVATDVGGVREMLDGGRCGVVTPPAAPEELARAIHALIDDADGRRDLRERAKRRFDEQYTAETMSRRYHELAELGGFAGLMGV